MANDTITATPPVTDQTAAPVAQAPAPADTGVWAGVKRNTVGLVSGLYHALKDPATDQEKQELLQKVQDLRSRGQNVSDDLATNPSRATLAYHRLMDAPANVLAQRGKDEQAAAKDLLAQGKNWKAANAYTSGIVDRGLAAVPMLGPWVSGIAQRYESGDVSGAATDIAMAHAYENVKPLIEKTVGGAIHEAGARARENMAARQEARIQEAKTGDVIDIGPQKQLNGAPKQLPAAPEPTPAAAPAASEAAPPAAEAPAPETPTAVSTQIESNQTPEGKLLYHYTSIPFESFDPMIGGFNGDFGAHLGTIEQAHGRMQDDLDEETAIGGHIRPVYVDIKNPLRVEDHGKFKPYDLVDRLHEYGLFSNEERDALRDEEGDVDPEDFRAALERHGYDGLVYLNRSEGVSSESDRPKWEGKSDANFLKLHPEAKGNDSYVALRSEQIQPKYEAIFRGLPSQVSFDKLGGVERRGPASFGRNRGAFGSAVDAAFETLRNTEEAQKAEVTAEGPTWDRTHTAAIEGKRVGSVGYKIDPRGVAQVYGAVVEPKYRGRGLAQKMYRSMIDEAQRAGASSFTSDPTNTSPDAVRVWERLRDKGLPVEDFTHPNGKPGYKIDFTKGEVPTQAEMNASPEDRQMVANNQWDEDPNTGYRRLQIHNANGDRIGMLTYSGGRPGDYARVRGSVLEPEYRNRGIAKEAYKSAIEDARKQGLSEFKSDTVVSPHAQHVWESLIREGYPITKTDTGYLNGTVYSVDLTGQGKSGETLPAKAHEPVLAARGQMPNQKVNLSPAYGETGKYVGGLIESRVSPDQYRENLGVTQGSELMKIPESVAPSGQGTHEIITHELAHAVVADMVGLPTTKSEVWSHLHPEISPNAAASFKLDYSGLPGVSEGSRPGTYRFSNQALKEFWPKALPMYLAGGVAQELVFGLPIEKNEGMQGDLQWVHKIGEMLGFTPEQVEGMIQGSIAQTKEMLNHPATLAIIKQAAGEREDGLSRTLHASSNKVQEVIKNVREARSEKVTERDVAGHGKVVPGTQPGTAGGGPQSDVREGHGKALSTQAESEKGVTPNLPLQGLAQKYAESAGLPAINHEPVEVEPERAKEIAQIYDEAKHEPDNPLVKAAYNAFKTETKAQFLHLLDQGLKFEPQAEDPYPSAAAMMDDIRQNNRLKVFTGSSTGPDHPLSEVDPETGQSYNTMFRWVHDAMGHAAGGNDFSEAGEKSATEAHAQMYSDEARPAMRTETEGQTSWFFHNPDVESGKKPLGEFAPQKATLVPDLASHWHIRAAEMVAASPAGGINPHTMQPDTTGYGTEFIPESKQRMDHQPTAKDFQAFYRKNKSLLDENPELRIGWDKDPKLGWELNLGVRGTDREAIMKIARNLDQRAIWDIAKGEEIPTGGQNLKTSFPDYSIKQRMADLRGGEISTQAESSKTGMLDFPKAAQPKQLTGPAKGATTPLMKTPLTIEGTGPSGRTTLVDLAGALNEWSQAGLKPQKEIETALHRASAEMTYQLAQDNTGTDWYEKDLRDAIGHLQANGLPELSKPVNEKLFRTLFGITSYGVDPDINLASAAEAWKRYQKTGKIPLTNGKTNWPGYSGIKGSITLLNKLIDENGEQGTMDWLLSKHPVSEIREQKAKTHESASVPGKATDEKYGTMIFGPKGGAYVLNLHGISDDTTVDIWGGRTIRRWTGNLTPETMDKPVTTEESRQFKDVVSQLATKFGLDNKDAQAVLWQYEHDLYAAHGAGEAAKNYKGAAEKYVQRQKTGTTQDFLREQSDLFAERYGSKGKETQGGGQDAPASGSAENNPRGQVSDAAEPEEGDTSFEFGSNIPTKLKQTAASEDSMADPKVRANAARHEAAHSVISEALYPGSVNSTALTNTGGVTDIQPPAGKTTVNQLNPDEIRTMIATSYAGGLAEPGGTSTVHGSADRAERAQVLAGRGTAAFAKAPELQAEGRARVEALMADPNIQKQIDTLATHITTRGKLTGDEVRAILRPPVLTAAK